MWSVLPEPYVMWVVVDWMARLSESVLTPASLSATDEGVAIHRRHARQGQRAAERQRRELARADELPVAVQEAVARRLLTDGLDPGAVP